MNGNVYQKLNKKRENQQTTNENQNQHEILTKAKENKRKINHKEINQ